MEDLLIFPYSGTAIEALDCLGTSWRCIGFVSDDEKVIGENKYGITIYSRTAFDKFPGAKILAVNGGPDSFRDRKKIIEGLPVPNDRFASVIHPAAFVGSAS